MDTLQGMKVFVRVAQRGGFATAGRDLRMSPAAVTKHVAAIESRVGARLLDRTTRSVGLTEAGRVYLDHCLECLQAVEDAEASVSELSKEPKGLLRVSAPVDFGNLAAVIARFMNANPGVSLDLQLNNRPVDLVDEGFDIAIRVAASLDGRYVARPIAITRVAIFGAPAYLEKYGRPRTPKDLERHRSLVFSEPRSRDEWTFDRDGSRVGVKLSAVMTSNNGEALCAALVEGVGLGAIPSVLARRHLDAGRIEPVLSDWRIVPELGVYAVYPHRRFLAPKVKAFVEALRAAYGDGTTDPWLPVAFTRETGSRPSKKVVAIVQ
jgi:DNA-binding transcriptional LysR family regulator